MKVLIVGSGGREHAIAWKCARSPVVDEVLVAPGNAGTALEPKVRNRNVPAEDIEALVELALSESVDLTIVGPEVPLVEGIVDVFEQSGLKCFGPCAAAAQLEGSKAFTKEFLSRHNIPTAGYRTFTDFSEAASYVKSHGAPVVIKADGLAAGKGVVVAMTEDEALAALRSMLDDGSFGSAGSRVVIEEFLAGEEASFIVVTDGETIVPLATSQDHKARDEGDTGPNTGGMGAYSPAPVVSEDVEDRILSEVIRPTLQGLRSEGVRYRGFLYAGLMIMPDGSPKVIEFNCRMGDPETQPIMMRLTSDLAQLCLDTLEDRLSQADVCWDERAALGVVMAAGGYPAQYAKGAIIRGLPAADSDDCKVFHAGTRQEGDNVVTSGGRVLCVVGLGDNIVSARDRAYRAVEEIDWTDVYYRRDIGHRAIARARA